MQSLSTNTGQIFPKYKINLQKPTRTTTTTKWNKHTIRITLPTNHTIRARFLSKTRPRIWKNAPKFRKSPSKDKKRAKNKTTRHPPTFKTRNPNPSRNRIPIQQPNHTKRRNPKLQKRPNFLPRPQQFPLPKTITKPRFPITKLSSKQTKQNKR